jgi:hypothetical protein
VIIRPDSFLLHVGQAIDDDTVLRFEGRRLSGVRVPTFPAEIAIEDWSIAETELAGLTGLKVGRTRMVVRVISKSAHAPASFVPVRVVP